MAELVAELIGELAPVPRADIDDDPGKGSAIEMQPDVGGSLEWLSTRILSGWRSDTRRKPRQASRVRETTVSAACGREPPQSPPTSIGAAARIALPDTGGAD
jgi:hypothetical protein